LPLLYNRTTQKLKTPSRPNPKEKWIRTPKSFEHMIEPKVFARAQEILAERARFHTPEYMLEKLETLFQLHGVVRPSLIRAAAGMPSSTQFDQHWRSLPPCRANPLLCILNMAGRGV
jgi:hypothetical protein